ncbi:MAG: hypothetical protein AAF664_06455, partial [Planctomycetota bacterium]
MSFSRRFTHSIRSSSAQSPLAVPVSRGNSRRGRNPIHRRRPRKEKLEDRRLLASDVCEVLDGSLPADFLTQDLRVAEGEATEIIDAAEQVGSDVVGSFASGFRQAVSQISRVLSAVNQLPDLAQEIPYLSSVLPESIGGSTIIDTESINTLFDLAGRFDTDVLQPLEAFLDGNPTASAQRLVDEFDFLESVQGLASDTDAVRLNFAPLTQVESTIASLLEPITTQAESLLQQIRGDALATELPFNLSTESLSFDVLRDAATEEFAVRIPNFSIGLERPLSIPVDFNANIGLLSGGITGGSISLDAGLDVRFGDAFPSGTVSAASLVGGVGLEALLETSIADLVQDIDVSFRGEGLNVTLPFEFDVAGFGSGNTPPLLTLVDANPFDSLVPEIDLTIPEGANFDRESILGFQSLDPAGLLSAVEQVGTLIGAWEDGDLLDTRIPLAGNTTIGDAVQFADSFVENVTAFLKGEDGTPAFQSIQEFINLIPGVDVDVAGVLGDAVAYDPETQALEIELAYFSELNPIIAQADLNFVAGVNGFELGSFTMDPGEDGTSNTLTITGDVNTGMKLSIDLSRDATSSRGRRNVAETIEGDVVESTLVQTILERKLLQFTRDDRADGIEGEAPASPTPIPYPNIGPIDGNFRVGNKVVNVDFGTITPTTSLGDLIDSGNRSLRSNPNAEFLQFSFDVKVEGKNVVRFFDSATVNLPSEVEVTTDSHPVVRALFPSTGQNGVLESVPLADRAEVTRETSLDRFIDPRELDFGESTRPIIVGLRDGSEQTVNFGSLEGKTVGDLLDAFTLGSADAQLTQAEWLGNSFRIRDLSAPNGESTFRLSWDIESRGNTLLENLLPIGYDTEDTNVVTSQPEALLSGTPVVGLAPLSGEGESAIVGLINTLPWTAQNLGVDVTNTTSIAFQNDDSPLFVNGLVANVDGGWAYQDSNFSSAWTLLEGDNLGGVASQISAIETTLFAGRANDPENGTPSTIEVVSSLGIPRSPITLPESFDPIPTMPLVANGFDANRLAVLGQSEVLLIERGILEDDITRISIPGGQAGESTTFNRGLIYGGRREGLFSDNFLWFAAGPNIYWTPNIDGFPLNQPLLDTAGPIVDVAVAANDYGHVVYVTGDQVRYSTLFGGRNDRFTNRDLTIDIADDELINGVELIEFAQGEAILVSTNQAIYAKFLEAASDFTPRGPWVNLTNSGLPVGIQISDLAYDDHSDRIAISSTNAGVFIVDGISSELAQIYANRIVRTPIGPSATDFYYALAGEWIFDVDTNQSESRRPNSESPEPFATWTVPTIPGRHAVLTTWTPKPDAARDATFTIRDDFEARIRTFDQTQPPPQSIQINGIDYAFIGLIDSDGDPIRVTLQDDTLGDGNGLIAGSVRIVPADGFGSEDGSLRGRLLLRDIVPGPSVRPSDPVSDFVNPAGLGSDEPTNEALNSPVVFGPVPEGESSLVIGSHFDLRDGTFAIIDDAGLGFAPDLGDVLSVLSISGKTQAQLVNERIVIADLTSGDSTFRVDLVPGSLLDRLLIDAGVRLNTPELAGQDLDADGEILSQTLSRRVLTTEDSAAEFVPELTQDMPGNSITAHLRDGTTVDLNVGEINPNVTIGDVLNRLTIRRGLRRVVIATLEDNRIVLRDNSRAISSTSTFFLDWDNGLANGATSYFLGATNGNSQGVALGKELLDAQPDFQQSVFSTIYDAAPNWTTLSTVARRLGTPLEDGIGNNIRSHSFEVQLADGRLATFEIPEEELANQTIKDIEKRWSFFDTVGFESELLAEVQLQDDRWVVIDYTTGNVQRRVTETSQNWLTLLFENEINEDGFLQTRKLSETLLDELGTATPLELFFDPSDARTNQPVSAPIQFRLSNGEDVVVQVSNLDNQTVGNLIEELTVRQGGLTLVRVSVDNDQFVFEDLSSLGASPVRPFSMRWITREAVDAPSIGGQWLGKFAPAGFETDADGDGVLRGRPFMAPLPGELEPVSESTAISSILARKLIPFATTPAEATVTTRDGQSFTIETGLLEDELTLGEFIGRLAVINEDGDTLLAARLVGDQIQLIDQTDAPDGQQDAELLVESSFPLFTVLGLTGQVEASDPDQSPTLVSNSLSTSRITRSTSINDLIPGLPIPDGNTYDIEVLLSGFRDGESTATIAYLNEAESTVGEVLDRFNQSDDVSVSLVDGRFVIRTSEDPGFGSELFLQRQIGVPVVGELIDTMFLGRTGGIDSDGEILLLDAQSDGEALGVRFFPELRDSNLTAASTLGTLFETLDINAEAGIEQDTPIRYTLSDGSIVDLTIRHASNLTLSEYVRQYEVIRNDRVIVVASLAGDADSGLRIVLSDYSTRFSEAPQSELTSDLIAEGEAIFGGTFSITVQPGAAAGSFSNLPLLLGVFSPNEGGAAIAGSEIKPAGKSILDRIRITEPPSFVANLSVVASDINATATIGGVASASLVDGSASALGSVGLSVIIPPGQDSLSLRDLGRAIVDPLNSLDLDLDLDVQASAELQAELFGIPLTSDVPGERPRFDLVWDDVITADPSVRFQPENLQVTTENFGVLIPEFSLRDIPRLIRSAIEVVNNIASEDLLGQQLPIINVSLADSLAAVDRVAEIADNVISNPEGTLEEVEDAIERGIEDGLGLDDSQRDQIELDLLFDADSMTVLASLDVAFDVIEQRAFDLNLASLGLSQTELDARGLGSLSNFVDFSGSGEFAFEAGAMLSADLGLDLVQLGLLTPAAGEVSDTDFQDAVVVFDTTGVEASARIAADDISFDASILSVPVSVGPGRLALDRDGLNFDGTPETSDRASIAIRAAGDWIDGRKPLLSVSPSDFEIDYSDGANSFSDAIGAGIDLPLSLGGGGNTQSLQVQWNDLSQLNFEILPVGQTIATAGLSAPNQIALPDVVDLIDSLTLGDGLVALANSLLGLFESIEDFLGDEILGIPVPLIGEGLEDAVSFVEDFVAPLATELQNADTASDRVAIVGQNVLYETLGPGSNGNGLDVLRLIDQNGDGALGAEDIRILIDTDREVSYEIAIERSAISTTVPLDLDVGGSALGLDLTGDAQIDVNYGINFIAGFDLDTGGYVEFVDGNNLDVEFVASVNDLVGEGRLGPLDIGVETIPAANLTEEQRRRSRLVESDPNTETINAFRGNFGVDFPSGQYNLGSLGSIFSGIDAG